MFKKNLDVQSFNFSVFLTLSLKKKKNRNDNNLQNEIYHLRAKNFNDFNSNVSASPTYYIKKGHRWNLTQHGLTVKYSTSYMYVHIYIKSVTFQLYFYFEYATENSFLIYFTNNNHKNIDKNNREIFNPSYIKILV